MYSQRVILILSVFLVMINKAVSNKSMVTKVFQTKWQSEGVGATVRRAIGVSELETLDPFLMLDFAKVKLPAGFPDHPHRGFEAVSYCIQGGFTHEDFFGNKGSLSAGDIQWMTAGRGIVHSEVPSSDVIDSWGFQVWINLPSHKKLMAPKYQDMKKEEIPNVVDATKRVIVIAGEYKGVKSIIKPESTAHYYDVHLQPGAHFEQTIPEGWNGMVYAYTETPLKVENTDVAINQACVFKGNGGILSVTNSDETKESKFIIIYGQPLNEPVAWRGPFVMNTQEQLSQAISDYRNAKNGFENAKSWKSKNSELVDY